MTNYEVITGIPMNTMMNNFNSSRTSSQLSSKMLWNWSQTHSWTPTGVIHELKDIEFTHDGDIEAVDNHLLKLMQVIGL